jgi:hypothetical protein
MSREAMQDGFLIFRSGANYHCRCSAQIALAGGLDEPVQAAGIINGGFWSAFYQNKAAEMSVRGVLTAMSVKIPITKLLKIYTSEASVITGAIVAMWKATKHFYIQEIMK